MWQLINCPDNYRFPSFSAYCEKVITGDGGLLLAEELVHLLIKKITVQYSKENVILLPKVATKQD